MYCSKCGNKMQAGEMFCGNCGTPRKGLVTEPAAPVQVNPVTAEVAASTDTNKEPAQTTPATAATPSPATPAAKKKPPKKALIIIPVLLALIAIGIFVYLHFFSYRSVKIESYDGDVTLERKDEDKEIFEGLKLIPDDEVTTGEDGTVELLIDTDKHLVAAENTCFSINAAGNANSGKVTITLEYGSALATIDEKLNEDSEFEIETPNCTCSVRGTTFEVAYDEKTGSSHVAVTKGVVRVDTGSETLELHEGEAAVIENDHITKTILFGSYEQDGNLSNGPEPIEWDILEEGDGAMLLVSRYILDAKPYNTEQEDVTWETCTLRGWLNEDFYNAAFTSEEQTRILVSTLSNPDNTWRGIVEGGNDTQDKVFILGVEEIMNYYPFEYWDDENRQCGFCSALIAGVTPYAEENGVWRSTINEHTFYDLNMVSDDDHTLEEAGYSAEVIGKDCGDWWLRSPGSVSHNACYVVYGGYAGWGWSYMVDDPDESKMGVRPALWLQTAEDSSAGDEDEKTDDTDIQDPEPVQIDPYDIQSHTNGEGYVVFGTYEQDNNLSNGPEPIEWEVLDTNDNGALLISRYVLDAQPYGTEDTGVTWENSTLRQWLNDDFYNTAFSDAEKEWILTTTVRTGDNEIYGTSGGNDTQDRVFCLSTEEIREHFDLTTWISEDEYEREEYWANPTLIGMVTPYAVDRGALAQTITQEHYDEYLENHGYNEDVIGLKCSYWWLRSPGTENGSNLYVGYSGMTNWKVNITSSAREDGGVRPALYITQ